MIKTVIGAIAALGALTALCQNAAITPNTQIQAQDWQNNNFTNKIVMPTTDYFTNNQSAISTVKQQRDVQSGPPAKGAVALHQGPRVEVRQPTSIMQADPWVQPDHPWDINTPPPASP